MLNEFTYQLQMNAKFTLYHLRLSQEMRLALMHGARAILPLAATDSGSNNAMEDEDDARRPG